MVKTKADRIIIEIPIQEPKEYKKGLKCVLQRLIVEAITHPDREHRYEGYELAILLLPIWLELSPKDRMINLILEIIQNRLRSTKTKTKELTSMLEVEIELRELEQARKGR